MINEKNYTNHNYILQKLAAYFKDKIEPSSWLIYGPEDVNKTEFIINLIKTFSDFSMFNFDDDLFHPDFIKIFSVENKFINVDEIRKIKNFIQLTPSYFKYKIVLIEEASYLNQNAFNALLKILEEPHNTIFFLTAVNIKKLPKTIISRCRKIYLKSNSMNDSANLLIQKYPNQTIEKIQSALKLSLRNFFLAQEIITKNLFDEYYEILEIINENDNIDVQKIFKLYDNIRATNKWDFFSIMISRIILKINELSFGVRNFLDENEKEKIEYIFSKCNIKNIRFIWDEVQFLIKETGIAYLDQKQSVFVILQTIKNSFFTHEKFLYYNSNLLCK